MSNEFHKPFIKSLITIALLTVFAMVSFHYSFKYYSSQQNNTNKVLIYTAQESNINSK